VSKKPSKTAKIRFNVDALTKDQALLDALSVVTTIFTSTKRRPAARAAFFGILKFAATLLLVGDNKLKETLRLLDKDAIRDGYGAPSSVSKLVKPVKRKKAVARSR
jgi:hypothetical protein